MKLKAAAQNTIVFYKDGEQVGDPRQVVDGIATMTVSGLNAGSYTFYAEFGGDDTYKPVNKSNEVTVTVTKADAPDDVPAIAFPDGITALDTFLLVDSLDDTFLLEASSPIAGADISYSSSDTAVATVDADGEVTIKGAGNVTITATAQFANYKDVTASYRLRVIHDGAHKITEGAGQTVRKGNAALFTSNAPFTDALGDSNFVGVRVDGEWVDPANYEAKSGSTEVTLKTAYVKTLSVGDHTVTIVSYDGAASTTFTVKAASSSTSTSSNSGSDSDKQYDSDSYATGDTTDTGVWLALALMGLAGLLIALLGKKFLLKRD